jgi:hypothetical protein
LQLVQLVPLRLLQLVQHLALELALRLPALRLLQLVQHLALELALRLPVIRLVQAPRPPLNLVYLWMN